MDGISTREAARRLGISPIALSRYVASGKVPTPAVITLGRSKVHVWTAEQIEHVRQLLPKIANGRKTRYKKQHSAVGTHGSSGQAQQSAKPKCKTRSKKKK